MLVALAACHLIFIAVFVLFCLCHRAIAHGGKLPERLVALGIENGQLPPDAQSHMNEKELEHAVQVLITHKTSRPFITSLIPRFKPVSRREYVDHVRAPSQLTNVCLFLASALSLTTWFVFVDVMTGHYS